MVTRRGTSTRSEPEAAGEHRPPCRASPRRARVLATIPGAGGRLHPGGHLLLGARRVVGAQELRPSVLSTPAVEFVVVVSILRTGQCR